MRKSSENILKNASNKLERLAEILTNVVPNAKAVPITLYENNNKRLENLYSKLKTKEIDFKNVSRNNKLKIYNYLVSKQRRIM
jgi:formate-dependent phosphoribosylglycinamide formyltransferase (GAR transformylase)